MRAIIEIRKADGLVVATQSWSGVDLPTETVEFAYADLPDVMRGAGIGQRFRRVADGSIQEFTPPPTERDLLAVRFAELAASDWTAVADREPMPEWRAYRQALRDITAGGGDVPAMIAAFPLRPDGTDAIAHLR